MNIGETIRSYRLQKGMSQGEVEKRTGLLRCYLSRVENGHTVPSVETLEKIARALEIPLYKIFYEGDDAPKLLKFPERRDPEWGLEGKEATYLYKLRKNLA